MVPKIEFFKRAVDEEPFHVKYYKKDEDPDLCGDVKLPLCYNPGQTCAECHDQEWLECNLFDQGLHEKYSFLYIFFLKYCSKTILTKFR